MNKKATPAKRQKSMPYCNKGKDGFYRVTTLIVVLVSLSSWAQSADLEMIFSNPPKAARPWVFWYWINGCVSKAHRAADNTDFYFISNQQDQLRHVTISLRITGRIPELWNPVTGDMRDALTWRFEDNRTILPLQLAPSESLFVVLRKPTSLRAGNGGSNKPQTRIVQTLKGPWTISFDPNLGGPENPVVFDTLQDWSSRSETSIRYYSGTASYSKNFSWLPPQNPTRVWLDLGTVANLAEVFINDRACGVAWTAPYRVEINDALHPGDNQLRIEVTNTWANRLIGDHVLPESERITWTTASYRLDGAPLLKAGLLGPVTLTVEADE